VNGCYWLVSRMTLEDARAAVKSEDVCAGVIGMLLCACGVGGRVCSGRGNFHVLRLKDTV
jgi:hypothetical protein